MFSLLSFSWMQAQQLAFPGAEGFGRFTTGGRGGAVYEVTNLNDSGPGSFRAACMASGARTIVFRVSGTITLLSEIKITNGNLTIAGQTAPGDGICIRDYEVTIDADNVIIRYLRFRVGNDQVATTEPDAINCTNHKNIIIDHCSMSWSVDETGSFYDNENFTLQWCILSESLYNAGHSKGNHGYGGIQGGMGASFHHNLYASHYSRNPRFCGARYHQATASTEIVDFRNNVIFNWGTNSAYGGEYGQQNIVNNYYKYGPATQTSKRNRIVEIAAVDGTDPGKWYIDGNYVDGYPDVSADNWANSGTAAGGIHGGDANDPGVKVLTPFSFEAVTTETALDAYTSVLANAGANFPARDAVDTRIINEVQTGVCAYGGTYGGGAAGSGIIDSPTTVGGWPTLNSSAAPADTDHDGMPDDWETDHGFNPNFAGDRNAVQADGYTALEKYLNCLIGGSCPSTPSYSLNVSTGTGSGSVTIDPPGGTYAEGTVVILTPVPDADYIFQNWSGDETGTTDPLSVTMSADKTITANFQSAIGMMFDLDTASIGPGHIVLDPLPVSGQYVYGTTVTVAAVPTNDNTFQSWSGDLSGTEDTLTILINGHKSITAQFLSSVRKKVAYVTEPASPFYANDTEILPALLADPRFEVTEVLPTETNFSPYDVVIISEVPGSTSTGMSALEGMNKPVLMMKVHAYKSDPYAWDWIVPTTGYGQNSTETNILVSDTDHPIFEGVTFVNGNEVQMLSAVSNSKGLTFMNPLDLTSVSGGSVTSLAIVLNNSDQSCIVQIPAGTTISGTYIPQPFIQVGINSNSYANVTEDGVQIVLNACYYLSESAVTTNVKAPDVLLTNVYCYPTMVHDKLTIDFSKANGGEVTIDITDLAGQNKVSLSQEIATGESAEVNLSALSPGLYICRIQTKEGFASYKIVKK